jgi:hypothetical protein
MAYSYTDMEIGHIRGDSFVQNFEVIGIELPTGTTAKMQVKKPNDDTVLQEFKPQDSTLIVDGNFVKLKKLTFELEVGIYVFDVEFLFPDGEKATLFGGNLRIKKDTTR